MKYIKKFIEYLYFGLSVKTSFNLVLLHYRFDKILKKTRIHRDLLVS